MGQLRDKKIVQSRIWLDPNQAPLPSYDYDLSFPITVYEAVKRTMDDNSTNLFDELDSIYRLIADKQNIISAGTPGQLMTWSGIKGQIGAMDVVKSINSDPSKRSHQKIPSEKAIGDALDNKVPMSAFNTHINDSTIHITDVERSKWNNSAPLSSLQAHVGNSSMHITDIERAKWNLKADQVSFEEHIYNANNPHNVTAHQVGTYTRREIDDMFEGLHESFFNYLNIAWDERTNVATLEEYHPSNWNPNYVLNFADTLPEVPDPGLTYFALKPATDYHINETADCLIYIKRPALIWQEVGFQSMKVGDMIIRYPDTTMFVWVQGRFLQLFAGNPGDDPGGGGGGTNNKMWRPTVDADGKLSWAMSVETIPPAPAIIKGTDGKTPIKGVDYVDGIDGKGVAVGGKAGDLLIKLTDENYNTTWRSISDVLADYVLAGGTLPEGVVVWTSIKGRPEWYNEMGPNEDGFITQKAATRQFEVVNTQIVDILEKIGGSSGIEGIKQDLFDHVNDFNNPHRVTSAIIGAASIGALTDHIQNLNNPHSVTTKQLKLDKIDNTADMDKPISKAAQDEFKRILELISLIDSGVAGINFITTVSWNNTTGTLVFTYRDGTQLSISIPIAEIFNSIYFDETTKDLVIVLPDGSEHRINIAALIQTYYGSVGTNIQVIIEDDNVVRASIIPGTVGELEIALSVHLRGAPTTSTQPVSDKSTRIATTEFVRGQVIDNLISYETDRALSANMGRILNQRKADIQDVIDLIDDIEGVNVIDTLDSTSPLAALSANMGRHLDLVKAPRVHTSPSGTTFGRATISLFGHARASDIDPLMDGTVFRGTDDGYFARADHRHPTDITRAPIHFPDVAHDQYAFTGEPRSTLAPDDSNDDWIATTEWVRRNAVGVSFGECETAGKEPIKIVTLRSDFMEEPVFLRQTGSTVAVTFTEDDEASPDSDDREGRPITCMNVHGTGIAPITFGGNYIIKGMLKKNHTHLFTFDGMDWKLINPRGIHTLPDDDNTNSFVSSQWVRRNVVGVSKGESSSTSGNANKVATLRSTFMDPVVFMRQIGTTVAITFANEDRSGDTPTTLNVQNSGVAKVIFGGASPTNGMIGKKYTHMFVFDGTNWCLINPVPGTGEGGPGGIIIGPGGKPDVDPEGDNTVVNRHSGHQGFTTQGDGHAGENGLVSNVWIAINFAPRKTDVDVTFSDHEGAFAIQMGDGSSIIVRSPKILDLTRSNCVVQFSMDTPYPSNSPCQLVYRTNNAWINIKEI